MESQLDPNRTVMRRSNYVPTIEPQLVHLKIYKYHCDSIRTQHSNKHEIISIPYSSGPRAVKYHSTITYQRPTSSTMPIRVTILIKKLDTVSTEDFHAYWVTYLPPPPPLHHTDSIHSPTSTPPSSLACRQPKNSSSSTPNTTFRDHLLPRCELAHTCHASMLSSTVPQSSG